MRIYSAFLLLVAMLDCQCSGAADETTSNESASSSSSTMVRSNTINQHFIHHHQHHQHQHNRQKYSDNQHNHHYLERAAVLPAVKTTSDPYQKVAAKVIERQQQQQQQQQAEQQPQVFEQQVPQMPIFINQSNNIYILAKYGQTVSLPCIIFRQRNQDLTNVHAIWHKLTDRQRPIVLSIGLQQLKQDMRYRIKAQSLSTSVQRTAVNRSSASSVDNSNNIDAGPGDALVFQNSDNHFNAANSEDELLAGTKPANDDSLSSLSEAGQNANNNNNNLYLVQNWQFEIRKLTYDDAGTYQCLLPLVKPLTKNITLQVIPDLVIEPKEGNYKIDDKITIKCKATLKAHQKSLTNNLNQRQQKVSIYWYKENEMIRSSDHAAKQRSKKTNSQQLAATATAGDALLGDELGGSVKAPKIEIETKQDADHNLVNSVLTIHNAKLDDSGKYRCIYDTIQEQVTVNVVYDYFEYKNFLTSSADVSYASHGSRSLIIYSLFVFCISFLLF